MADATMLDVFKYFSDNKTSDYKLSTFRKDWEALSEQDKTDLRTGIGNGSLTY
jgi:hypothetical protein